MEVVNGNGSVSQGDMWSVQILDGALTMEIPYAYEWMM